MKIDNLGVYERDDKSEAENGIDVQFPNGITFTILRAGGVNYRYTRSLAKYITPDVQRRDKAGTLTWEEDQALWRKIYTDSIIIGMKGVMSGGKEIPFTRENVDAVLEASPEMFKVLRDTSDDLTAFRRQEVKEESEKLGNSSGGTTSGESTKTPSSAGKPKA